jgi:NADH dehydrogenase/NADH:ubiquinone oxidoreductase subunit G
MGQSRVRDSSRSRLCGRFWNSCQYGDEAAQAETSSKQDWLILTELGRKLGAQGFEYKSPKKVAKELREFTKELGSGAIVEIERVRKAADWNPVYRGAILAERIQDLKTFIDALPKRERALSTESMDDFVKRISEQEGADTQVKEVA